MTEFLVALGAFLAAHLIPASRGLRARLIGLAGRRGYLVGYSCLSLVLLAWLVTAAQRADTPVLWIQEPWQRWATLLLMPLATFLLVAGLLARNPLSISFRSGDDPGEITAITRHPVLWAFLTWAVAHVLPNGTLVAAILFGGMALFSIAGFALLDRKARRTLGAERWDQLAAATSIIPFAAIVAGRARLRASGSLFLAALLSAALYGWFVLQGHAFLIGPDPLAGIAP